MDDRKKPGCALWMIVALIGLPMLYVAGNFGPVITGLGGDELHLTGDYWLVSTSADQKVILLRDGVHVIGPKVVEVAWDKRFILAKRQELAVQETLEGRQEAPVKGQYDYWVLDTLEPKVYGPFDEAEFAAQRKALGVPVGLLLEEASFRELRAK